MDYEKLFDDHLLIIERSLQLIGLGDIFTRESKRSRLFLISQRTLYAFGTFQLPFLMLGEAIFIYTMFSGDRITDENFLKVAEVTPCFILCSLSLVKSTRLVLEKNIVINLIDEFRDMWPGYRPMDNDTKRVVDDYMVNTKKINVLYSLATHSASFVYNLCPLGIMVYNVATKGDTDYILPYLIWYPYDNSKDIRIWLSSYISQMYAGVYVTACLASADSFFGLLTSHLSMHLELLCKQIKNMPEESENYHPKDKLKTIVRHHNKLIGICGLIDKIFSPVILFNLAASSLMICVLLFSMTIAPPVLIAKYSVLIASAMPQILLLSWYGSRVIETSNNVGYAAYSCPWADLTDGDFLSIKKSLVMIIVRAKRPLCITAYGFTIISMKTFGMILKTSWSYFTLLRVIYKKNS